MDTEWRMLRLIGLIVLIVIGYQYVTGRPITQDVSTADIEQFKYQLERLF